MIEDRSTSTVEERRMHRLIFDTVAVRNLGELIELARHAGAPLAPVKGIVLSRWLYDHTYERPYRDLDLLASRADLSRLAAAVSARGWEIKHQSEEMGELEFQLNRVVVEIHAEMGRRDLSRLTSEAVLARATKDTRTFPFEVLRIDDVDHFFLLVGNVTKKTFTYANPHQPEDLERLIKRLEPRWGELIERARTESFLTALSITTAWMIEQHGSALFRRLAENFGRPRRRLLTAAIRAYRRNAERAADRLRSPSGLLGLALATLTPDDPKLRWRGLTRVVRRGLMRRLGRNPG